ncbi:MAG: hypothetical protein EBX37_12550, partial [Alphaproteobacteria bacterium]|nr:hypothetical protein [Alphaproteobacteria bacterium]
MKIPPFAPRASDRPVKRPPDLLFAANESMPWPMATAMALQHLVLQSIYIVLPVAVADALGLDTRSAANFLCLSLLAMVVLTLAHAMPRGPVGAGYQMASIPAPVWVSAYLISAANGVAIDQIGA